MLFASSRGGLGIVLVLGAAIYFSGAWPWLKEKTQSLDSSCYAALKDIGGDMTTPICGTLAKAGSYIGKLSGTVSDQVARLRDSMGVTDGISVIGEYTDKLMAKSDKLRSTQTELAQLIAAGPGNGTSAASLSEQFQHAVDSFAIGQSYLYDSQSTLQALPWLKAGAATPQGFGVMSQLSLAQLYATGAHGIPADNDLAQTYLRQANSSITMLQGNNSPQAQQMLQSLPGTPDEIQKQIVRAIKQIQLNVR